MHANWSRSCLSLLLLFCWSSVGTSAAWCDQIDFATVSGSTTSGGNVDATASFTPGNGNVLVTLTNRLQNPGNVAQLISALEFSVSNSSGTGPLASLNSGMISAISAGGTYSEGVLDPLIRWTAVQFNTEITLTALSGGAPNRLIIGADNAGGFSQLGLFSNANSSIFGHSPTVLGSATFRIAIPGVTESSTVSGVRLQFGSMTGSNRVVLFAVPEPSGIAICSMAGLAWMRTRRRKLQK